MRASVAGTIILVVQLLPCSSGSAQSFSFGVAAAKTSYSGSDYADTRGDWQSEAVVRYHFARHFRIGAGAEVGKFDESYSDPSFTNVGAFAESSFGVDLADRVMGSAGLRYGLEHERVGQESDGLWGWGWQVTAIVGLDYRVGSNTSVGLQTNLTRLDLRRDEDLVVDPIGVNREGWRLGIGLALRIGAR